MGIGLPGDHVEINNGMVSINGQSIKEDYVKNNNNYSGIFDVPEGKFLFLGDNKMTIGTAIVVSIGMLCATFLGVMIIGAVLAAKKHK